MEKIKFENWLNILFSCIASGVVTLDLFAAVLIISIPDVFTIHSVFRYVLVVGGFMYCFIALTGIIYDSNKKMNEKRFFYEKKE